MIIIGPCRVHPAYCVAADGEGRLYCRWCAEVAALTESYAGYSLKAETRIAALEAEVAERQQAARDLDARVEALERWAGFAVSWLELQRYTPETLLANGRALLVGVKRGS